MPIFASGTRVKGVYVGSKKINQVYVGNKRVFPDDIMVDDFTNATVSNSIWNVSGTRPSFATYGTAVEAGDGKGDCWTKVDVLPKHIARVEHKIYKVTDEEQRNSLLMGNESQNVYLEYGKNGWNLGYYNGSSWIGMASGGGFGLGDGSVIAVERISDIKVNVIHNGSVIGTGIMPYNVALGRKVGFTLRAVNNLFVWWRSPAIDDIRAVPL